MEVYATVEEELADIVGYLRYHGCRLLDFLLVRMNLDRELANEFRQSYYFAALALRSW